MGNAENQSGQEIRPESSKEWLKFFKENSPEEELLVKTIRENKNQDRSPLNPSKESVIFS